MIILPALLMAQINIEQYHLHIPKTNGLHGSMQFSMLGKDTSYTTLDTSGTLNLSYRLDHSLFIFSTSGAFYYDNHKFIRNNEYIHIRNNARILKFIYSDIFFQAETDPIYKLYMREFNGIGFRLEKHLDNFVASFGSSYMYEIDSIPNAIISFHRWNNFVGLAIKMDRVIFSDVVYAQPVFDDFSNVRFLNNTNLSVTIDKGLSIGLIFQYKLETMYPVTDIQREETRIINGLNWSF